MEEKKTDPKLPSYRVNFVKFWLFNIISQKNKLKFDSALTLDPNHLPSFPNTCWNCYKITIWSHLLIKEPNKRKKKQEQAFKNNTRDASSSTRLEYIRLWFLMPICSRKHPVDKRAIHLKLPNEKQNEASLMERGFCERRKSGMAAGQSSPM